MNSKFILVGDPLAANVSTAIFLSEHVDLQVVLVELPSPKPPTNATTPAAGSLVLPLSRVRFDEIGVYSWNYNEPFDTAFGEMWHPFKLLEASDAFSGGIPRWSNENMVPGDGNI